VKVMAGQEGAVCLDGHFMRPDAARVSPFDFGFLYGDGVFETLRTYGGRPFRLGAHLSRLAEGLSALEMVGAPTEEVLRGWVAETLARAGLPEVILRITVTRGVGRAGLDPAGCGAPTVFISALPLRGGPAAPGEGGSAVFLWPRQIAERPSPTLKSTSYQRGVLARAQLVREGAREGFFLDGEGNVTEGSTSNVFALCDGVLWTPPADVCLPGVTRAEVLRLARAVGLPTREAPLPRDVLLSAQELFITSSLMEIWPILRVDGVVLAEGTPGPWTQRLQGLYREQTLLPESVP